MYYKDSSLKIYYEIHGTGKQNILILPGWGNTRNTFQYLINNLQRDYTIYIIDYPGFGNSPIPDKELTIYDYALLIKNFISDQKISNPIVIAHSFGGRIASLLQGYYKINFSKLILIDVAGIKRKKSLKQILKEKTYKLLKYCINFLPKLKQEKYRQKLLLYFASADYKSIPLSMQKTFQNIITEDLKLYYKNIQTETLIIWGKEDQDTPLKDGILINKLITNSAIIVYNNSKHFSYLDYPLLTYNILTNFLKE